MTKSKSQKLARAMAERLSAEDFIGAIALTEADAANLNAIAAGLPVAGAANILRALGLKATLLVEKPAQRMDVRSVNLVVADPYSLPPEEGPAPEPSLPASPALPEAPRPRSLAERKKAEWDREQEAQAQARRLSEDKRK